MSKELNYRLGVLKRRFKLGAADQEPGTFINKINQKKSSTEPQKDGTNAVTKVSIRGLI